jgi:hypothetical protein
MLNPNRYPFNQNAGSYPFNQNAGAILSKRNYINRKLDEIEQKLIELGWMEAPVEEEEEYTDEFVESAGALIPYRNKVNERLNFYEAIIKQHLGQTPQETVYHVPGRTRYSQPVQPQQPTPQQSQQVEESFKNNFASIFG